MKSPAVVVAFGKLEHSEPRLLAGSKGTLVNEFFFKRSKEAFNIGVVQAGSGAGKTWLHSSGRRAHRRVSVVY